MTVDVIIRLFLIIIFMVAVILFIVKKVTYHFDYYNQIKGRVYKDIFHVSKRNGLDYLHIILPIYFKNRRNGNKFSDDEKKIVTTLYKLYITLVIFTLIAVIDHFV